jgi:hypothetical protein
MQAPAVPRRLQPSHWPVQAVLQQTPSAQLPLAHCAVPPQEEPFPRCGTQIPAEHQSPAMQSESAMQPPLHVLPPQA